MKDSFTLDDFILYSTGFGSLGECERFEDQKIKYFQEPKGPDQQIISNILNYSLALSVIETKGAGNVKLVLN